MDHPITRARSFLFAPASRPERFAKALDSGADCVVIDLEDAVTPEQKDNARALLVEWLPGFSRAQLARTLLRINPEPTSWHAQDLALAAEWIALGMAGVMIPKAESAAQLHAVSCALGTAACVLPLIESLSGLDAADLLARSPQVLRLVLGHLDLQVDLGMQCGPNQAELAPVRFALLASSRRASLAPPVDGVTPETRNAHLLQDDLSRARAMGFGAKLCVHPSQVSAVNQAFTPSASEIDWARRVLAGAKAHDGAAFGLDGRMVDLPVIRQAQRTLQRAKAADWLHTD